MTDGGGTVTVQLVSFVAASVGAVAVIWFRIEGKIAISKAEVERKVAIAEGKVARLKEELAEHQIEVVRNYASVVHLKEVENRLVTAIDRLTDKIEERWPARNSAKKHPPAN